MRFRILDAGSAHDLAAWVDLWGAWPGKEIVTRPEYAQLFARPGDRVVCAVGEEEHGAILFPLVLRPLALEPWAPPGDPRWDAVTPYGYGGAFACGRGAVDPAAFWAAHAEWCREARIVTTFARLSLFPEQLVPMPGPRRGPVAEHPREPRPRRRRALARVRGQGAEVGAARPGRGDRRGGRPRRQGARRVLRRVHADHAAPWGGRLLLLPAVLLRVHRDPAARPLRLLHRARRRQGALLRPRPLRRRARVLLPRRHDRGGPRAGLELPPASTASARGRRSRASGGASWAAAASRTTACTGTSARSPGTARCRSASRASSTTRPPAASSPTFAPGTPTARARRGARGRASSRRTARERGAGAQADPS